MLRRILIAFAILLVLCGVGLFLAAVPDVPAAELDQRYGTPPSAFLILPSGTRAHYRDRTGPPGAPVVVLVHGSNASLHTWEPWVERLSGHVRIVSVDLPGHGLTGATVEQDYTIAGMAAFLDAFTKALGLDQPFVLAGNSMGGNVAWRFALAHPDRVAKLVLVDAGGVVVPGTDAPVPLAFRIARTPGLREIARFVTPRSLFDSGLHDAFYDPALVTPAMVDRYWELNRRPGTRAANVARFSLPFDVEPANHLGELKLPVLILWGRQDKIVSVHSADVFKAALPQAELKIYDQCGHLPMEEKPDQSAADLLAFIGT